ncbi:MAG: ribosome maturation factor RimM [Melioribacteraceae bacterium]|nr:ribosome maturation factor RimM [Melioribacteraceae bacterium]MCF8264649.1 ribosome maturation factor RimM [Melioribacteraceae bacterium]MCF8431611.1 ribosome maturation factor RimM [Melioribacteraceae bacterium]
MESYFLIAEVSGTFNRDGSLVLKSHSDFPERFSELLEVFSFVFGGYRKFVVENMFFSGSDPIVKFKNFDSREDVLFLIGKKLYVDEERLFKTEEDSYFIHDLIGSSVFVESVFFGKLVDVLSLPANDVYVVNSEKMGEVMVPVLKKYFKEFIQSEKRLILNQIFLDEYEN